VPRIIVYDNLKPAVLKMLHGHARQEQVAFAHFHSVYRFEPLFANPRSGWEKGSVENLVGYTRRNYFVPIPEVGSWDELHQHLRTCAVRDQQRVMSGRTDTIATRLAHEQHWRGPLPAVIPEGGLRREVVVRSTARVHFETNQYSVPSRYAYQRVALQAAPFHVRIIADGQIIAEHPRSYAKHQVIEDWRHYVQALLEKPFAVPFASAVRHGGLPAVWESWRQSLVARRPDGNREFARLLELAATTSLDAVTAAMTLIAPHIDWDATTLRQVMDWAMSASPAMPELPGYPELAVPDIAQYDRLLEVKA
jgi:hypothetical protein